MKEFKIGAIVVAALTAVLIAWNSWTIIPVGEEGVTNSFGKVHPEEIYGFNWVPFWYSVDEYSLQHETRTWSDAGIPSQDKFKTNMDISFTGHFIKGRGAEIRENTGVDSYYLDTHVDKKVLSCTIKAGGTVEKSQRFFDEEVQKMMSRYVADCVNTYIVEEAGAGYEVTEVQFTDIRLDPQVKAFMVKTKEREEGERQQESLTRAAEEKAKIIVQDASARDQAAEYDKAARMKAADAALYEQQQQAAGNKELAQSLTPELIEYIRAKNWDGKLPTHALGENTMMMIGNGK